MSRSDNWAPRKAAHNEPAHYRRCWKGLILIRLSIMILHVLPSVTQLSMFSEPLHLEEVAVHSLQFIQPEINVSLLYSKGHFLQIFTLPFALHGAIGNYLDSTCGCNISQLVMEDTTLDLGLASSGFQFQILAQTCCSLRLLCMFI
jgi:hypothetical protein